MTLSNPSAGPSESKKTGKTGIEPSQFSLFVNGNPLVVPHPTEKFTVADLMKVLQYEKHPVAVEINTELIPKRDHDSVELTIGDQVEIVTLAGGG